MKIWLAIKDQKFCALTQDKVDGDASGTEKHEPLKKWQKLWCDPVRFCFLGCGLLRRLNWKNKLQVLIWNIDICLKLNLWFLYLNLL